jgi:sugar lactone lactonase YvrE
LDEPGDIWLHQTYTALVSFLRAWVVTAFISNSKFKKDYADVIWIKTSLNFIYMKILLKLQIGVLVLAMLVLNTVSCTKENPPAPASNTSAGLALDELVRKTGNKPKPLYHCPKPSANYGLVTTFACLGVSNPFRDQLDGYPLAADATVNLYVAIEYQLPMGWLIKKITPAGVVTIFSGNNIAVGSIDGPPNVATFRNIMGMAFGPDGNLYLTDSELVRKVNPAGEVSTVAGIRGNATDHDGPISQASFIGFGGLTIDKQGNIFVSEYDRIRKIIPGGVVSTLAGSTSGSYITGYVNGTGSNARFNLPEGIVFDETGNLYVADRGNFVIRKITSSGVVTTFAGSGAKGSVDGPAASASFERPGYLAIDPAGNIYVSDYIQQAIRKITPDGIVSTLAGSKNGESGYIDGLGSAALFNFPVGLSADKSGNLFVVDQRNKRIRKIVIK